MALIDVLAQKSEIDELKEIIAKLNTIPKFKTKYLSGRGKKIAFSTLLAFTFCALSGFIVLLMIRIKNNDKYETNKRKIVDERINAAAHYNNTTIYAALTNQPLGKCGDFYPLTTICNYTLNPFQTFFDNDQRQKNNATLHTIATQCKRLALTMCRATSLGAESAGLEVGAIILGIVSVCLISSFSLFLIFKNERDTLLKEISHHEMVLAMRDKYALSFNSNTPLQDVINSFNLKLDELIKRSAKRAFFEGMASENSALYRFFASEYCHRDIIKKIFWHAELSNDYVPSPQLGRK